MRTTHGLGVFQGFCERAADVLRGCRRVGVYQDGVEVRNTELVQILAQGSVDVGLERGGGVGEAKRHDEVFEMAVSGAESCLPLVAHGDADKVVCGPKVDLGVELRSFDTIKQLGDEW